GLNSPFTTYDTVYSRLTRIGITPHPAIVPTKDIIDLHNKGLTPSTIAKMLGLTRGAVYMRLVSEGITPHRTYPLAPVVPTEDIIDLHNEGLTPGEIAARLNMGYVAVYMRLQRAGMTPNVSPLWVKAKERKPKIVKLHREGLNQKQIAERLGLTPRQVGLSLREEGEIPRPSAKESMHTLQAMDEIIRLSKEGVPRYEIAKHIDSTWPLVAAALKKASGEPIWPACEELTTWAETLLPLLDEI
ncbi:unnamed protein product, partial [marine sediment metagenome]